MRTFSRLEYLSACCKEQKLKSFEKYGQEQTI